MLKRLRASPVGPALNFPRRFLKALPNVAAPLGHFAAWSVNSREDTNYTYELSRLNIRYLAHAVAIVTKADPALVLSYMDEATQDRDLADHVIRHARNGPDRSYSDARADFGRRLGWYAIVRLTKPSVVVETGVDKGLGSVILAAALLRNGTGRYYGTDIDPTAGRMLSGRYAAVGEILYGDSLKSLDAFSEQIDLFINDSDHSPDYEMSEYEAIASKLAPGAIVLGDESHLTDKLMQWSERTGRSFLFWAEQPLRHWFPGAGIGFSFSAAAAGTGLG